MFNNNKQCKCGILGCIACREQTQTAFASATTSQLGGELTPAFLTLVPLDGRVRYGELMDFDLKAFARRHRVKLAGKLRGNITVLGAVDVSLNCKDNTPQSWSFHFHTVLSRPLSNQELMKLKESYPIIRKKDIYRPVQEKLINDGELEQTAAYGYKSYFLMRSQYLAKPKSDRNPYQNSRDIPMNRREAETLETFLNQYKVTDSLILIGAKRVRSKCPMDIRFMTTK